MGIAGLILGIISLVLGWAPIISILALILAIVGLILSIVDTVKKNKSNNPNRGISIAGIIVSAIAFIISGIMTFIFIVGVIIGIGEGLNSQEFKDSLDKIEDGYYDIQDNYDLDYYLDDFMQNNDYDYDYDFNL